MDYEAWSEILERSGVDAVQAALEDLAGRVRPDELAAAVDLACKVIADDTARITARGDQTKSEADRLHKEVGDLEWQVDMLIGFTIGELSDPPESR
ncbi:hypothetical protein [Streptomyces lincolnensis]|uniref:hypothetical protein n=1 Tax=Streptomyces lincolnensis TaxID=1915 RepID=UPI0037D59725